MEALLLLWLCFCSILFVSAQNPFLSSSNRRDLARSKIQDAPRPFGGPRPPRRRGDRLRPPVRPVLRAAAAAATATRLLLRRPLRGGHGRCDGADGRQRPTPVPVRLGSERGRRRDSHEAAQRRRDGLRPPGHHARHRTAGRGRSVHPRRPDRPRGVEGQGTRLRLLHRGEAHPRDRPRDHRTPLEQVLGGEVRVHGAEEKVEAKQGGLRGLLPKDRVDDHGRRSGAEEAVVRSVGVHLRREEGAGGTPAADQRTARDVADQGIAGAPRVGRRRVEEGAVRRCGGERNARWIAWVCQES
ncbi:hypothetical protein ACHAWF_016662 [Thalassiosira exigua]